MYGYDKFIIYSGVSDVSESDGIGSEQISGIIKEYDNLESADSPVDNLDSDSILFEVNEEVSENPLDASECLEEIKTLLSENLFQDDYGNEQIVISDYSEVLVRIENLLITQNEQLSSINSMSLSILFVVLLGMFIQYTKRFVNKMSGSRFE